MLPAGLTGVVNVVTLLVRYALSGIVIHDARPSCSPSNASPAPFPPGVSTRLIEIWFGAGPDPQDAADLRVAYLYGADGKKNVFDEMWTD